MSSEADCRSMPSSSTFIDASAPVHPACVTTLPPSPTASTSAINAQPVHEFTGTTIFAPPPAPTYRYAISLKNDSLRIWLEDCDSKKQWCTSELGMEAYVDPTNAIPDAAASDYVECFREVLNSAHDDVSSIASSFQQHKGDVFRLEIAVKIQVIRKSRVMVYTFDLNPISLERVDVLEAKVKDLQEEVEALRLDAQETGKDNYYVMHEIQKEVSSLREDLESRSVIISALRDELKAFRTQHETLSNLQLQATAKVGELIRWEKPGCTRDFFVNGGDGIIRVSQPGLYQAIVMVNHQASNHNMFIAVMKGAECIQKAHCGYVNGGINCTTLSCIVSLEAADQLSTQCNANLAWTSCLTLIRIGKTRSSS